ncbi:MAG: response regulator [Candidatus Pacebacteria bacterium]|nr:response regulator [Candidatus Paceibacterota bacterium]
MRKKKKKILLVEDEPLLVEIYEKKLKEIGVLVLKAFSAEEAKKYLEKEKNINLIVLDILLPKQNGISFLSEVKKSRACPSVVILSNLEDVKLREKAKKLKVKEYLLKANYTPAQIVEKIKKYL